MSGVGQWDPDQRAGGAEPSCAERGGVGSGGFGLSKAHILPWRGAEAVVAGGGRLLECGLERRKEKRRGGGKRGMIGPFSRAARRRMMKVMNRIDRRQVLGPPLFVSLTVPGGAPAHWVPFARRFKRDLEAFLKRFWRFAEFGFPGAFVVWRLEPQKRGAPHLHLLIFNVPYLDHALVSTWWWEIVGSGDPEHLKAGTRVEACRTWEKAGYYMAKYMAKPSDESGWVNPFLHESYAAAYTEEEIRQVMSLWENPGRWWGVRHRERLPYVPEVWAMTRKAFYRLRRLARKVAEVQTKGRYRMRMQDRFSAFLSSEESSRALAFVGAWRV